MPEWIKDLIIAIGGGSVVLVGIFTIFKKLFIKLFESGIESSFEKSLEKYRNKLSRSTRAYELLLDREMQFYEKIGPIFAELIPLEHDLLYQLKEHEGLDRENRCESFRTHFCRYTEVTIELKNETLVHQSYIPMSVFLLSCDITEQMQKDLHYWHEMCKVLFAGEDEKIDYEKGEKIVSDLLLILAAAQLSIKKRLEELSKIS